MQYYSLGNENFTGVRLSLKTVGTSSPRRNILYTCNLVWARWSNGKNNLKSQEFQMLECTTFQLQLPFSQKKFIYKISEKSFTQKNQNDETISDRNMPNIQEYTTSTHKHLLTNSKREEEKMQSISMEVRY